MIEKAEEILQRKASAKSICHLLEVCRWIGIVAGFQFAFFLASHPQEQFHILMPWVVISIAGLTGIESLFFGEAAMEVTGYGAVRGYQRQSGMNNLALAVTAILTFVCRWGLYAEVAVMSNLLIFVTLSAGNHLWSAVKEGNRSLQNMLRPAMTLVLIAAVVPCIIRALE